MSTREPPAHSILVIGDVIVDHFCYGRVTRISAEAPISVFDEESSLYQLGGAANVARHLASLGLDVKLLSVVGSGFTKFAETAGVTLPNYLVLSEESRRISIKRRFISNFRLTHLFRADSEDTHDITAESRERLLDQITKLLPRSSAVVMMDYVKGVFSDDFMADIINTANRHGVPSYIDTKRDDLGGCRGAFLIKPNLHEFRKIKLRYGLGAEADYFVALQALSKMLSLKKIVVTLSENGIVGFDSINDDVKCFQIRGLEVPVVEVSGAGDTVIAGLVYGQMSGRDFKSSLEVSNHLAAKFVSTGVHYVADSGDIGPYAITKA